jgi:hypothetical protein
MTPIDHGALMGAGLVTFGAISVFEYAVGLLVLSAYMLCKIATTP